ncbi:peptidoglycan editing factor PgeF [Dyadobacter sandarakinus]|uniref:Purine nucleoside phosphorylase n=1 Tax=Dyadobacter sandarakinus TaxID=2747268 RepID=A0ABX7I865_9BACT|nr:peptidoglycan editing factor PgeF [Dyadobacter sandarakinus]QRR01918.1 peptidoglycan editing factor PgeF [Dyadobacter sandarakinus]
MPTTDSLTTPMYRCPAIFQGQASLIAAESTRHGGVSPAPYHSLNLGGSTQDDPAHVAENNRRFFAALGVKPEQVAKSHQVHGDRILPVTTPGRFEGYDALITHTPGVQIAVTVADCTPILIYDPVKKTVAAIHAGWRGTVAHIVRKTLVLFESEYGVQPDTCLAYVGTCIDECSFEVNEDVAMHFDSSFKRWDSERSKFFIDLKKANREDLLEAGVRPENVEVSAFSTVLNNEDYFSHRLEKGLTGRMLATIGIAGT